MSFSDLGLAAPFLASLAEAGYTQPTQVQRDAIPAALEGADLLVSSQTGSGKTAAFMLPSLQRLLGQSARPGKGPRILVLAPTRELALQVKDAATGYAAGVRRFTSAALVGGAPYAPQMRLLSRPLDLVVATPGRLIDHLEAGRIDFSRLEVLILDEADRMLDMGFLGDIERIVAAAPADRQTLLFSATLDGVVGDLARRLTRAPRRIDVAATQAHKADIEQVLMFADDLSHKSRLLDALLRRDDLQQCVVFAATKQSTEDLREQLAASGFSVAALHGDMHQGQRNRTLERLRDGRTRVLVATDVAARGIDVAGITHVINFDAPRQAEDYVHRIGRTGRAGRSGVAVTLLRHDEGYRARVIERYTGQPLRIDTIPGLEPRARPQRPAGKPGGWRGKPGGGHRPAGARPGGWGAGGNGGQQGWRAGNGDANGWKARGGEGSGWKAASGDTNGWKAGRGASSWKAGASAGRSARAGGPRDRLAGGDAREGFARRAPRD
ncbi:DEAD/DEAH box helicase [Burkholderiaceae bacterium FT117]|uniref:DEAD/DEAH box helicase n=1 Tax=Zeimonas sediminis TaxID=2944268 RepID=UPI002342D484|nr:DEAD/DEAH box helicase [Zeimonas sediminis]MCM5569815.1 DEAD/DEAH box helicase [Zeimonas sediminis]